MGYIKTKWLMLFKDYNSLKENGVLKVKKDDYLSNTQLIESNVCKSKTSNLIVFFTIMFFALYLAFLGGYGIACLLNVSDTKTYMEINFWIVKAIYLFVFVYLISYVNINVRKSNLLRVIGLPMIIYCIVMAILIYKFAEGVSGID